MRREFHVRFCEGGGVRFPSATRPVLVFSNELDARRVMDVLPKRFGKYGLTLHPTKTRLLRFDPPGPGPDRTDGPGSFDFLGLRHHWGRSRRGAWMVQRKTAGDRFGRTRRRLARFMRVHRHAKVAWQHLKLTQALRGHYAYFGVSGNLKALRRMQYEVARDWWKWLRRRGQRARLHWDRFKLLLARYPLPEPRTRSAWGRHLAANPST